MPSLSESYGTEHEIQFLRRLGKYTGKFKPEDRGRLLVGYRDACKNRVWGKIDSGKVMASVESDIFKFRMQELIGRKF